MAKKKATSKKAANQKVEAKPVKKVESTVKKTAKAPAKESALDRITNPKSLAQFAAELVGTFLLTVLIFATQAQPLALLFGLTIIVLILGNVSGAHVNPLITVGAWATRRIGSLRALGYVIAQFLGSMLAFVVAKTFVDMAPEVTGYYGQKTAATLTTASAIPEAYQWGILFAELLGAAIFAFAVAHVTANKKHNNTATAFGVGGGLFIGAYIGSYLATLLQGGVILNPAVAVALQAFTVESTNTAWAIATYLGASLIGGLLGFGFSKLIKNTEEEK
ncbi:MAG: aquaporin [bacterium]|nr:aquaporin [bacterium]